MPPVNLYAAGQIATTAAAAVAPTVLRALPPPVAAAPNLTAATAIDIGTVLPYTTQQNMNFGGVTQTGWYKYTAQAGDVELDVFGFGDTVAYSAITSVFSPTASQAYLNLVVTPANVPLQFPVVVGDTYWFRTRSSAGNVASALLTFSVRRGPKNPAPSGSILIIDDGIGFAAALLSAFDGTVLQFKTSFASSEAGDVLNTGELCVLDGANASRPNFYDKNLNLILASTLPFRTSVSTNKTNRFYIGDSGAGPVNASVTTATAAGVRGATTWTFGAAGLGGMAPSPDETILYYVGGASTAVQRWDLVNNVALADLIAGIVGFSTNDIIVLNDGTVLALYWGATFIVKRYSTTGAVLNTYTLLLDVLGAPRICRAVDDPTSFWAFTNIAGGLAAFQNIKVSDGTVLTSFSLVAYEKGRYQGAAAATPANYFGPSQSCPIIIIRNALMLPGCPDIT